MEILDLYDENRKLTGRDHVRGEDIPDGFYHLVVHVWIRNSKGEYLISQRSADRPTHPLMWECVGGSVVKGEDSLTGAIREAQEEVGVLLSPEKGTRIHSEVRKMVNGRKFNDILDVWLFEHDGPILLEQATTKEVAQSVWMSKAEIQALLNEGKLVPTLRYFMDML